MSHLFTAGTYVQVAAAAKKGKPNSDGGTGWIKSLNEDGTYNVEYVVPKKLSKEVVPSRIAVAAIAATGSRRTINNSQMPSLLSPQFPTAKRVAEASSSRDDDQPIKPKRRKGIKVTEELILESPKAIYDYLKMKNKVLSTWLDAINRCRNADKHQTYS